MIQPRDQVELDIGQVRRNESHSGVIVCLLLGPSPRRGGYWEVAVLSAVGSCEEYIKIGVTDHPASWFLEETTVLA